MNKTIIAILLSLTIISPSFSSALYGTCKTTEDSNLKNRPKGDDWNSGEERYIYGILWKL